MPVIKKDTEKLTDKEPDIVTSKNPEFTTSRQVLAIYYMLNSIDKKVFSRVNRAEVARFIEFLTGKNYHNVYTHLSNLFKGLDTNNNKKKLQDFTYVKSFFDKLGLKSIDNQMENDMKG